jgi:hypothetical protein
MNPYGILARYRLWWRGSFQGEVFLVSVPECDAAIRIPHSATNMAGVGNVAIWREKSSKG